ncbi:RagB/SusD family nutrient uptake outer membrane protein [Bacteroides congonensis]
MKKKHYIVTSILSVASLFMSSCLDLNPLASIGDNLAWEKADNFQLFANQFYSWTRDFQLSTNETYGNGINDGPHSDFRSDLIATSTLNAYSQGTNTIPSEDKNYTALYQRIYYTNLLLEKAQSFGDQGAISMPVAEAKFFRAYLYFELVQIYGDVILVTKPLDLNSEELRKVRDDRSVVIDQIIKDLQEAATNGLPETATEKGRLTKYAAYAMLSRVALYEGTWQKFHNGGASATTNTERSSSLLTIAKEAAEKVIGSKQHKLFYNSTLGTESYRYMFILEDVKCNPAGLTKSDNTEYILSRRHRDGDQLSLNITHAMFGNAVHMTRKLANMYLCTNGLPIDNAASTGLFKGYANPADEFKNRDNRMANTFMIYGEKYWDNKTAPRSSWDENDLAKCITANNNWICKGSGYQNHKWAVERSVSDYYETMDYPVIRYAEVLLNYAEAVYELGITGSALDEALNISLNLVRWRSNPDMPGLSTSLVSANGLSMREEIRRERALELILEGFRIDDLKRWYVASTEMPQVQLGVKYTDTWFETNWSKITNTLSNGCLVLYSGRTWQDKNYLYPLPSDQLQLNPQLGQNPGWGN